MANYGLNIQNLHLSDDGPPKPARTPTLPQRSNSPVDQDARDAALRAELAGVQNINKVIEGVIESLEKAKANMEVCILPLFWMCLREEMIRIITHVSVSAEFI